MDLPIERIELENIIYLDRDLHINKNIDVLFDFLNTDAIISREGYFRE